MKITRDASVQVAQYWIAGQRNPDTEEILADNILFPRTLDVGSGSGAGFIKAIEAGLGAAQEHRNAEDDANTRRKGAAGLVAIRVQKVFEGTGPNGFPAILIDLLNGSSETVTAIEVQVSYLRQGNLLAQDPKCGGVVSIPPGGTGRVGCYKRAVQGTDRIAAQILDVRF